MSSIEVKVIQARNLPKVDTFGKIDPYFVLVCNGDTKKTTTKKNTYNPIYTETFTFSQNLQPTNNEISIKAMDWDLNGSDEEVGKLSVKITGEHVNRKVRKWYPITGIKKPNVGEVELEIIHSKPVSSRDFPPQPQGYGQPPPQGYGQAPPPGYGQAPPPGYGQAPPLGYGQAPPPGYGQAPPPGYGQAPLPGYGQPAPQIVYVQPAPVIVMRSGPMKVYIQQKVLTWGDKFDIREESGTPIYWVKGEVFTIGKKLHITDTSGTEVAFINEKVLTMWAQYDVEVRQPDVMLFTVKREYKIGFGLNFNILGLNWTLKGDFADHDYRVFKGESETQEVFYMHKHWMSWGDSYEIIIHDPSTVLPCVCIALSIDAFLEKDQASSHSHSHHGHRHHH